MKLLITSIVLFSCLYFGCTKVVQVNVKNAPKQIVIQGNITNTNGPYFVTINETVNYAADNIYPPVSGAIVTIADETSGTVETLKEQSAGVYATNIIQGKETHVYKLTVTVNGKTYTAIATMPKLV
ncbi:MAG: DUF4249 family protein, partial [Chitinophagaceae bacterium]